MAGKKHRPEEAVAKLRQVDVLVSQGQSVAEAIRAIGVTEVTYVFSPGVWCSGLSLNRSGSLVQAWQMNS
jgi:hypothetical protein